MFQNLDKDSIFRMTLEDFHNTYNIIEDLEHVNHNELIKNLMNEK